MVCASTLNGVRDMADVTGGTPPTGISLFDVPADIKKVYEHFGDPDMFSRATVGDLPASGNWKGRTLFRPSSARCTVIQMCLRDFNIAGNFMMISKILINVGCNNLCGRDCFDNRSRSACTIPSCKYSRKILKCSRTFSNDLTTFLRDTRLFEVMCLNILSNCYD